MRIAFVTGLLFTVHAAYCQIDVRQYASEDLFAVKPVVTEQSLSSLDALTNSWVSQKYELVMEYISDGKLDSALTGLDVLIAYDDEMAHAYYLQGIILYNQGENEKSRNKFRKTLLVDPLYSEAKYMLGILELSENNPKEAKSYFDALKVAPASEAYGYYGHAKIAIENNNATGIIKNFEKCIQSDSSFIEAYIPLASAYLWLGRKKKAEEIIDNGIRIFPDWEEGIITHAIFSMLIHSDMELFEKDLEKLLEISPDNYHYYFMRSAVLIEKQEWTKAIEEYKRGCNLDSRNTNSFKFVSRIDSQKEIADIINYFETAAVLDFETKNYIEMAICAMITNEYGQAKEFIAAANEISETSVANMILGMIHEKELINEEEILNAYSRAIELDSTNTIAISRRGDRFLGTGNFQSAYLDFNRLLEILPKEKEVLKKRAITLTKLGYSANAYRDYSAAIGMDPNDLELFFNRATVALNLGKYEAVNADLHFILQRDPHDDEAYYLLHLSALMQNDTLKALTYIDSASMLKPYKDVYHSELYKLSLYLDDQEYTITALTRLLKSNRSNSGYLLERGKRYYYAGKLQEAIGDLENYIAIDSKTGVAFFLLGKAYDSIGEPKKSQANFKKAERLGFNSD